MLLVNQLNGFNVGGGAGPTTLTQVASATANAASVTGPADIQAGDLLVLYDVAYTGAPGNPTTAVPSGFTVINNSTGLAADTRLISSYKIADGSEASASLTGMDGADSESKMLYVFRGNVPITSVSALDVAQQGTSGNPTAQVVNASGGTPPLIVFGCYSTFDAIVSPRTFSTTKDGEINANPAGSANFDNWLAYKIYNTSPADSSIDMDDEGAENYLSSFYIACA